MGTLHSNVGHRDGTLAVELSPEDSLHGGQMWILEAGQSGFYSYLSHFTSYEYLNH